MPSELSQAERTALEAACEREATGTGLATPIWLAARDYGRERERTLERERDIARQTEAQHIEIAIRRVKSAEERERALEVALVKARTDIARVCQEGFDSTRAQRANDAIAAITDVLAASPGEPEGLTAEQIERTENRSGGISVPIHPDHGPGEPSGAIPTELIGADEVKRGDTIWAHDDGDWLLVDTYIRDECDAEFRRKDGSLATFDLRRPLLRRVVQVGESNG